MISLRHKGFSLAYGQARQRFVANWRGSQLASPQLRAHWLRCGALLAATVLQVNAAIQTAVGETQPPRDAVPALDSRYVGSHPTGCVHRSTPNATSTAAHACDGAVL